MKEFDLSGPMVDLQLDALRLSVQRVQTKMCALLHTPRLSKNDQLPEAICCFSWGQWHLENGASSFDIPMQMIRLCNYEAEQSLQWQIRNEDIETIEKHRRGQTLTWRMDGSILVVAPQIWPRLFNWDFRSSTARSDWEDALIRCGYTTSRYVDPTDFTPESRTILKEALEAYWRDAPSTVLVKCRHALEAAGLTKSAPPGLSKDKIGNQVRQIAWAILKICNAGAHDPSAQPDFTRQEEPTRQEAELVLVTTARILGHPAIFSLRLADPAVQIDGQ